MKLSQRELANILGISHGSWQVAEAGSSVPGGQTITKLAELGFDANWILTGKGAMRLAEIEASSGAEAETPSNKASNVIDPLLLSRITDAIAATYKEFHAGLSPRDLGFLGAEKYTEIVMAADSPDEYPAMLKLMIAHIRKELSTPAASTDTKKASA